jgi:hypothetical protein
MQISRELFDQQRHPRFGTANPERMHCAFWEWMIRGEETPQADHEGPLAAEGLVMRDGKLKSSYGPCRARDFFHVPLNREDGPIWTFDRMGGTRNQLPDGRMVCIGGEHEDFYDPDFCIYNDVIVFNLNGEIEIYGYPKAIFPPTDFHTASLVGNQLVVVGSLGYKNERFIGHTPVYFLDLSDFHIDKIETTGEMPGWISEHEAVIDHTGAINIRGGQIVRKDHEDQLLVRNLEDFSLDLKSRVWRQVTDRKWYHAKIQSDHKRPFPLKPYAKAELLLPQTIPYTPLQCDWRNARILIENVEVSIEVGLSDVEVVVQGNLSDGLRTRVLEEIQMNIQVLAQTRCSLRQL